VATSRLTGVRIALQGHQPFYAAAKAVYDTLQVPARGRIARGLKDRVRVGGALERRPEAREYKRRQASFLR